MTSSLAAAGRVPDPEFSFGDRIRKARLRHDATQREFADLLEVKHPTYAAWELGTTTCPRETAIAKRVEVITGVRAAWLLGLDEPAPLPPPDGPSLPQGRGSITARYSGREQAGVVVAPLFGGPRSPGAMPAACSPSVHGASPVASSLPATA